MGAAIKNPNVHDYKITREIFATENHTTLQLTIKRLSQEVEDKLRELELIQGTIREAQLELQKRGISV